MASERNFSSSIRYSILQKSHKNKQYSQNSLSCRNKGNIPQKALFMQDDAFRVYIELVPRQIEGLIGSRKHAVYFKGELIIWSWALHTG